MYERNTKTWLKHIDFMVLDIISMFLSFCVALNIRFGSQPFKESFKTYQGLLLTFIITLFLADVCINNLQGVIKRGYLKELRKVLELTIAGFALVTVFLYVNKIGGEYSRLLVGYTSVINVVIDYCLRILWKRIVVRFKVFTVSGSEKNVIIISTEKGFNGIHVVVKSVQNTNNIKLIGCILADSDQESIDGVSVISTLNNAADYICREWVDEIFLDADIRSDEEISFLLDKCKQMAVTVHLISPNILVSSNKVFSEQIGDYAVITIAYAYITSLQAFVKRLMDVIAGLVGCIFTVIIGIIIGPIIYIQSPGPILFKQKRVGKNGKLFTLYKFRSMYLDAEERKKEYMKENIVSDGMMFKLDFDPRIIGNRVLPDGTKKTGIGDFIRKTSLDEFPQFFNVLIGDMSLVGTRPPTLDEWEKYQYHHKARLATKPGITGIWQTSGRNDITDFEEVVRMDTEYINNFSLRLDIKLLFKTVGIVIKREGVK